MLDSFIYMTGRLKKTEETRPLLTGIKTCSLNVPLTVKRAMEDTNTVLEIEIPEEKSTDSTTSTDGLKKHSENAKSLDFDSKIMAVLNSTPSGENFEETAKKGQFQGVTNTGKSETICSNYGCGKNNEEGTKSTPVLLTDSKVVVGTGDPPIASKKEGENVTTGPKITVMDDVKYCENTLELASLSAQQRKASDAGSEYHDCASSISRQSVGNLSLSSSSPSDSHLEEMDIRVELEKKMKKSPSGSSICTFPTQSTLTDFCRICHCEGDAELGPLIAPCHCRGSLRYVHQSCLQQWIKSSDSKQCELCGYQFIMDSKLKPFYKWKKLSMTTAERRKIMCSVVFHVIAITCVIWSLFVLIQSTANEIKVGQLQWPFWTKLVVVAIGFTGGLVFMYVQCKVYVQLWKRLKAFNRVIYVKNNTPSGTNTPGGNSANDEVIPVAVGESIGSISTSNQQQQQQVSSVQSPQSNEAVNIELELTKL